MSQTGCVRRDIEGHLWSLDISLYLAFVLCLFCHAFFDIFTEIITSATEVMHEPVSVCLSVCLLVGLCEKVSSNFHETLFCCALVLCKESLNILVGHAQNALLAVVMDL